MPLVAADEHRPPSGAKLHPACHFSLIQLPYSKSKLKTPITIHAASNVMANSEHGSSASGQAWSSPIIISDTSDVSAQYAGPLRFKVFLYSDYRQRVILPELPTIPQGTRWIIVNTEHDRTYKVQMIDDGGGFSLQRGWTLLATIENLQEGQTLMFEQQNENVFDVWIHSPSQHPLPTGFTPARNPAQDLQIGPNQIIINPGTEITPSVLDTVSQVWQASSDNNPIYICRLLTSPSDGNCLIFNKTYTKTTPKNHTNVAMRFIGSSMVIPGTIKTYNNANARMIREWHMYAQHHNLTFGKILVCKIYRGPTVCEFIGACAPEEPMYP